MQRPVFVKYNLYCVLCVVHATQTDPAPAVSITHQHQMMTTYKVET
jgi:hypothetical protein